MLRVLALLQGLATILYMQYARWFALGLLIYAGAIELIQSTMPGRTGSWADFLASASGIMLACLFIGIGAWAWRRCRRAPC